MWPLVVVGLTCLVTGVLLGLGSKYGLVRFWWVAVKLFLNVVLVSLVLVALRPGIDEVSASARQVMAEGALLPLMGDMVFPPVVSTTLILVAMTLSGVQAMGEDSGPGRRQVARTYRSTKSSCRD